MTLSFTQRGWDDYQHWIRNDKRMLRRINELIKAVQRDPYGGIGKPEPLRHQLKVTGRGASPTNTASSTPSPMIRSQSSHAVFTTDRLLHSRITNRLNV